MNYEKAYNEALERAKKWYYAPNADKIPTYANRVIEEIFPELKESEDEKIRKAIISVFTGESSFTPKEEAQKYVAWLEKQGEKSLTVDIKSMVKSYKQRVLEQSNNMEGPLVNMCVESFRHGIESTLDELNLKNLEKQGEQKVTTIDFNAKDWYVSKVDGKIHDMIEDKDAFTNPGEFENSLGHLLKLFEKLPKQDILDGLKFYTNVVEHDGEYVKPTEWSDEDEEMLKWTNGNLTELKEQFGEKYGKVGECISWLKSLKERLCTQWKPNEVQMKALHDINLTGNISYGGQGQALIELYEQLKKGYHDR